MLPEGIAPPSALPAAGAGRVRAISGTAGCVGRAGGRRSISGTAVAAFRLMGGLVAVDLWQKLRWYVWRDNDTFAVFKE